MEEYNDELSKSLDEKLADFSFLIDSGSPVRRLRPLNVGGGVIQLNSAGDYCRLRSSDSRLLAIKTVVPPPPGSLF